LNSLPKIEEGVYLVTVNLEQKSYDALFHFGPRKTFGGDFSAEVHILDFNQEIYGETLNIELGKKLREVRAFKNADQLFTQIETDILVARKYFMRQKIKKQWNALSLHDQAVLSEKAVHHISAKVEFLEAKRVFVYAPQLGKEISFVAPLMEKFPDKDYLFPVVKGEAMEFFKVDDYKVLEPADFGIMAPKAEGISFNVEAGDLMLVPAVAADKNGNRLGKGGGFYDKYLATLDSSVKTLAILPRFAVVDKVPTQKHDQTLDGVVECEV